jgi:hypothetical protein
MAAAQSIASEYLRYINNIGSLTPSQDFSAKLIQDQRALLWRAERNRDR